MTMPSHEPGTYVALYGSHGGDWRRYCRALLDRASVHWHDPGDPRWEGITFENGDRHQLLIDELVAEEHKSLLAAGCVVFHLAGGPDPPTSLAARYELGLLAGCGIQTFVHIETTALGRNYLWAALKLSPHLFRCQTLQEAVDASIELMQGPAP